MRSGTACSCCYEKPRCVTSAPVRFVAVMAHDGGILGRKTMTRSVAGAYLNVKPLSVDIHLVTGSSTRVPT